MYLAIIVLPLLGSIVSGFFGRKTGVSGAQLIDYLTMPYMLYIIIIVVVFSLLIGAMTKSSQVGIKNKYSGFFSKNIINFFFLILLLFLFLAVFLDEDISSLIIKSAHADSDNEELPKRDKGKGRATEDQILEQEKQLQIRHESAISNESGAKASQKNLQIEHDYELAKRLQEEEYQENWEFLQNNSFSSKVNSPQQTECSGEYSVYSSEVHSNDSENTKNKKAEVKILEETLKRKYSEDSLNSNNKRKKNE